MANVKKEEARIEKIIRGLLKLPENRRCINCNLLGPQYICTTFSTFICTNCSGIHREFTHRVKSVSMAKFTSDEVEALQAGGNEKAKQIYFKKWDPQRNSYPDSNNIHKLRNFIKHAYVDKRFSDETSSMNLPKLRLAEKEEHNQTIKISSFRVEPRGSDNEDRFERHSSEIRSSPSLRSEDKNIRFYYDERSPRYVQNYNTRLGRKPVKFEVVDDRVKDDDFRNRRLLNLEAKLRQLQPGSQKNVEESQSPVARSSGEVSEAPSSKVGETSQANNKKPHHDVPQNKKNPSEQKSNPPESFIDSDAKSQASNATAEPATQPISQPIEDNWATFDDYYTVNNAAETSNSNTLISSVTEKTPQATTYLNSLDLLLSELSGPLTPTTGAMSIVSTGDNDPTTATIENASTSWDLQQFPSTPIRQTTASPKNSHALSITPTTANEMEHCQFQQEPRVELFDMEDSNEVSDTQNLSSVQFPPSVSVGLSSTTQKPSTPVTPAASIDKLSDVFNSYNSSSAFAELSPQTTSKPAQDPKPDVGSQPSAVETKSNGRKELPEDLFTSSYLAGPATLAAWQNAQPNAMGYGLQYYPDSVPTTASPLAAKSRNPFEETEARTISHTSSFPTLPSMHSALPSISPRSGLMQSASLGSLGMVSHSPSYGSPLPPHSPFSSGFPTGANFGQVNNNMQPPRPEQVASFNDDTSVFASLGTMQLSGVEYKAPSTPNSFSQMGRNPFGDD